MTQSPAARCIPLLSSDAQSRRERGQLAILKPATPGGHTRAPANGRIILTCLGRPIRASRPNPSDVQTTLESRRSELRQVDTSKTMGGTCWTQLVAPQPLNGHGSNANPTAATKGNKGWAARTRQHSNRPVLGGDNCQMNLLQALRPVLIASPPSNAASLIGSKGVFNPKAQVYARRDVTV